MRLADWIDRYPGVKALLQGDEDILDASAENADESPCAESLLSSGTSSNAARESVQVQPLFAESAQRFREAMVRHASTIPTQDISHMFRRSADYREALSRAFFAGDLTVEALYRGLAQPFDSREERHGIYPLSECPRDCPLCQACISLTCHEEQVVRRNMAFACCVEPLDQDADA